MEYTVERLSNNYEIIRIHREDLKRIYDLILTTNEAVTILYDNNKKCKNWDEFIYNGRATENERQLNSLEFSGSSNGIFIRINLKTTAHLTWHTNTLIAGPDENEKAKLLFHSVDNILNQCSTQRLQFFKTTPIIIMGTGLFLWALNMMFFNFSLIISAIVFVSINIAYCFYYMRPSQISLFYKEDEKSYLQRNKDKIGLAIITGTITLIVGIAVGLIVGHFSSPCNK